MRTKQFVVAVAILFFIVSNSETTAQRLVDKNGTVAFEASEALFEPVEAKNESVTAVFDTATNEIASLALIKGFRFPNSLMEEHFNENYIESETYPKATFKGKLIDFDQNALSENPTEVSMQGTMALHGKEKAIDTKVMVQKSGGGMVLKGSFDVSPDDFAIKIPGIVKNKIAKTVKVSLEFNLN